MQEGERTAWLLAALTTIGDMPEDLLEDACAAARRVCDHPAKIVPFICDHNPDILKRRRDNLHYAQAIMRNLNAPRIEKHDPQYMTAQDLAEIKAELAGALSADRN